VHSITHNILHTIFCRRVKQQIVPRYEVQLQASCFAHWPQKPLQPRPQKTHAVVPSAAVSAHPQKGTVRNFSVTSDLLNQLLVFQFWQWEPQDGSHA